ncbi:Putative membrane protein insertion efficiency factor [Geodia barretti]|uniref:Membrane protein insertion efficiency factor n=1 Tax=Geodia barretti TaxID=519541 RepID=A0AA35T9L0_GEOBA|nr:Putative membrane protein insertion efficiency factor [Geodia barretti]
MRFSTRWPTLAYEPASSLGPAVRQCAAYVPSCSAYALEALRAHGTRRGVWLTARRLARCHPWGSMGWDPVPAPRHRGEPARVIDA